MDRKFPFKGWRRAVAEKRKPQTVPEVPRGSFIPTERFSADMLEEVPREHVINVLLLHAKAMALPPTWAVRRWSQHQSRQKTSGHPTNNVLVARIRSLAVLKCADQPGDKYEHAKELLNRVPSKLFCGLSVNASASAIKKTYLAILGRGGPYDQNMFRVTTELLLREYLPLLLEAIDKADQ